MQFILRPVECVHYYSKEAGMDWDYLLETYPTAFTAIIGFIGVIVGIVSTAMFNRTKRKYELEDRVYKRYVDTYDLRIKEAREYVDSLEPLVRTMENFHKAFRDDANNNVITQTIRRKWKSPDDSYIPGAEFGKDSKGMSLYLLKDKELADMHNSFAELLSGIRELEQLPDVREENVSDSEIEDGIRDTFLTAHVLILRLKERLDILAQKID
jgi:hypothetical protein